jgi:SET domain
MILPHCSKIEVRKSPIEGYGVFATQPIAKGEVLEEVPFILFPRMVNASKTIFNTLKNEGFLSEKEQFIDNLRVNLKFKDPEKYYFKWFPKEHPTDNFSGYNVLPLGFGPIYNTSNANNNANWKINEETFTFFAEKDIAVDEEICTFYGYFVDEKGNSFNANDVFYIALDEKGIVKSLRFGDANHLQNCKQDSFYLKFLRFLEESKDGLTITGLSAVNTAGQELSKFMMPKSCPVSLTYQKLFEFKRSNVPFTRIEFYYKGQNDEGKIDGVVLRNSV